MLGRPGISEPLMTNVQAGSWLIAFVWTLLMTAMSSTTLAVCGSRSVLTHRPHWPFCSNLNLLGATGKRVWPLVIVLSRWPPWISGGRSLSKNSWSRGL
jgi:hypothetical protein